MITVDGFVIPGHVISYAFWLLARLIGIDVESVKSSLRDKEHGYKTIFISKGRGKGKRRLDIPSQNLKNIQELILKRCLYNLDFSIIPGWKALTGYIPDRSNRDNVAYHINGRFFLQLDIKDAFPSTNEKMVREALSVLFKEKTVRKMFRFRNMSWFRERFLTDKDRPGNDEAIDFYEKRPLDVLWAMREIIIWIAMFEDSLPQGAPTSPFLFNLVLAKLIGIIKKALKPFGKFHISAYADNITISSTDKSIPRHVVEKVIVAVERKTSLRINRKKVHHICMENGSPNITGLSIGEKLSSTGRIKRTPTVPEKMQRRARGMLHSAITNPKLAGKALGLAAYLLDVYGGIKKLPKQIREPYEKLLATRENARQSN